MSAPICGARTWASSGDLVTCDREPNHESRHSGPVGNDRKLWSVPMCAILLGGCDHVWTPDEARAVRDRIQRQLDALDPAAAVEEAERRMVEAYERIQRLDRVRARYEHIAGSGSHSLRLFIDETERAGHEHDRLVDAWLELVEARDAKGGGA